MHWLAEAVQFDAAERALLLTSPHGAASALIESGELSHSGLDAGAAKIRELNAKIGAGEAAPTAPTAPPADPSQPPAMPN